MVILFKFFLKWLTDAYVMLFNFKISGRADLLYSCVFKQHPFELSPSSRPVIYSFWLWTRHCRNISVSWFNRIVGCNLQTDMDDSYKTSWNRSTSSISIYWTSVRLVQKIFTMFWSSHLHASSVHDTKFKGCFQIVIFNV